MSNSEYEEKLTKMVTKIISTTRKEERFENLHDSSSDEIEVEDEILARITFQMIEDRYLKPLNEEVKYFEEDEQQSDDESEVNYMII
jgi:hypothetical protein